MASIGGMVVFIPLATLGACGALPNVKYSQLAVTEGGKFGSADEVGLMRYALPASTLILDYKKTKDGTDDKSTIELTPVAAESNVTLAVSLADKWGRATTLQWTKLPNTELLATVGTEVTDNRVKVIKAVAETATGLIGLQRYKAFMNVTTVSGPLFLTDEPKVTPIIEPFPVAFDPLTLTAGKQEKTVKISKDKASITLHITVGEQ